MQAPKKSRTPHERILIGYDASTGEPIYEPLKHFSRGAYITGESGQGKSELTLRILNAMLAQEAPIILIDDAGKTHFRLEQLVAFHAAARSYTMELLGAHARDRYEFLQDRFLRRHTFAFIGHGRANSVGIDILKMRTVPGRTETVEEVVIGNLKPFEARFPDISIRVRFLTVIKPMLAVLCAAKRPISEALLLLLDPNYWRFVMHEIETNGALDVPANREYVVPRIAELRRILDLRYSKVNGEYREVEPFPQRFWDRVESTYNALEPYSPGTVTAKFFEADSFSPEEVVFGRGVFSVTTDLSDELVRNQMNATIYTFFERLMKYRVPGLNLDTNQLTIVLDEVRWFYEGLARFFSVARNHRVSCFVLNQQDEQWEALKMPALAKVLPSLLRYRVQYRPQSQQSAEQMASRLGIYDPFGMQKQAFTTTQTTAKSESETETETESEATMESETKTSGTTSSRHSSHGEARNNNASEGFSIAADGERGTNQGWGNGNGESESWGSGESDQESTGATSGTTTTQGTSKAKGTSTSESESVVEHILTASVGDQHFIRGQELQRLPEHRALVSHENSSRLVDLLPFPPRTARFTRRNIHEEFVTASHRVHKAACALRKLYKPPKPFAPAGPPPKAEAETPEREQAPPAAPPKAGEKQAAARRTVRPKEKKRGSK